jgi:hypothetical protein
MLKKFISFVLLVLNPSPLISGKPDFRELFVGEVKFESFPLYITQLMSATDLVPRLFPPKSLERGWVYLESKYVYKICNWI